MTLEFEFDQRAGHMYVYPLGQPPHGLVWRTVPFDQYQPELGFTFADITREGRILGFEMLDAKLRLDNSWPRDKAGRPTVVETYDRERDEYRMIFGESAVVQKLTVRAGDDFPGFEVTALLSTQARVTAYVIPRASHQFWCPVPDDVPSPRAVHRRHHRS